MPKPRRAHVARASRAPADMESALVALGIELGRGDETEVHGICPKHLERTGKEDRHPSWSVNRNTGLHGCWSCGYSGNFQGLVMDLLFPNDAFRAARWVRQFGIDLQTAVVDRLYIQQPGDEDEPDLDLAGRLAMHVDPPDWALERRNLSAESCRHYGVRWDDQRDRWIVPIRRPGGELVGWQKKAEKGRYFRNFPMKVPKGECLFGFDQFPQGGAAVLLESPLDVVRLHSAGIAGGLSTYGASWTDTQIRLVSEVAEDIVLAFDDDAGGYQATHLFLYGDPKKRRRARVNDFSHVDLLNYDGIDAKDIGDMTDAEIRRAIEDRRFWMHELDKYPRSQGVHRSASQLSGRRREGLRRPRARTHRYGAGNR